MQREYVNKIIAECQQQGWAAKTVLPANLLDRSTLNVFGVVDT
jgi:hypothetical protein